MKENIIPIVFAINDIFSQHLCVTLVSLLENNRKSFFDIYVLVDYISEYNKNKIESLKYLYSNFKIQFRKISSEKLKQVKVSSDYISKETYYRFVIPEELSQYDKALYLDCDLIVNGSIQELYNIDLTGYYYAGVEERCLYKSDYIDKILKIKRPNIYINAGVLLMNLKLIREDNLTEKLFSAIEYLSGLIRYDDQDIINIVAKGKIKQINCIYNFTPEHLYDLSTKKYKAVIIHYTGKFKPWSLGECPNELKFLYYKYLEKTPYKSELKVKNFCVYHKAGYLFETDMIIPIQTGTYFSQVGMDIAQSSSDISIDFKNKNYGELVAWYWVLKNYLPQHSEVEYIGFCHYRRFLDYFNSDTNEGFLKTIDIETFVNEKNNDYSSIKVYNKIKNYDIILPKKHSCSPLSIEEQYLSVHPKKDLDNIKKIIKQYYPEYENYMESFLKGSSGYFCLLFTMKTELFISFMDFVFGILDKLEKISSWNNYRSYNDIRTPAYLIERFFNVWLMYQLQKKKVKILETNAFILEFPDNRFLKTETLNQNLNAIFYVCNHKMEFLLKKLIYKLKKLFSKGEKRKKYKAKYKKVKKLIKDAKKFKRNLFKV